MVKVGLISTLDTNIGDDFIREGIRRVVAQVFKGKCVEFLTINKHRPLSVYPSWHPRHLSRLAEVLPRGKALADRIVAKYTSKLHFTKFNTCDLIVQCGTPVLWRGCHRCEWAAPVWRETIGALHARIPVFNLAAGSCYPWEKAPALVEDARDAAFLREISGYCRVTTVRDVLAERLLKSLGIVARLIPCAALLASDRIAQPSGRGLVLINFMERAAHSDWNQGVSPVCWRETVSTLVERLRCRYRVEFLCHNTAELRLAGEVFPDIPRHQPNNPEDYFELASDAMAAVCNRLHASVALAGIGIPSVAVGTDTRLLMVQSIGLPAFYVKDVSANVLESILEGLIARQSQEAQRLLELRARVFRLYVDAMHFALFGKAEKDSITDARSAAY